MTDFLHRWNLRRQSLDMCRFGMLSCDANGFGLVKKPTGIFTNAEFISSRLDKRCVGGHRHVPLTDGRAKNAQIYPQQFCSGILKGLREQLTADGILNTTEDLSHLMNLEHTNAHIEQHHGVYMDDISGKLLDPELVRTAREEEMQVFREHNVFTFVPLQDCWTITGKGPIGTRWVDVNKNDEAQPEYRSRCVAQEINRGNDDQVFAGTPPVEAKKASFSRVMSSFAGKRAPPKRGTKKLLFVDVRRAFFYAPVQRPIFVRPPPEAGCPDGYCARPNVSLYGT